MASNSFTQLIDRLNEEGYTDIARSEEQGVRFAHCGQVFAPEELVVDQIIRCEGMSTPDDEMMLFALQSPDGQHKATFASAHGVDCDPLDADAVERLRVPPHLTNKNRVPRDGAVL